MTNAYPPLPETTAPPSSIIIERVQPKIDGGRYPIKRVMGDVLRVSADIFKDSHDKIAAVVQYRRRSDADRLSLHWLAMMTACQFAIWGIAAAHAMSALAVFDYLLIYARDIRSGAAVVLAALAAEDRTVIIHAYHLDRDPHQTKVGAQVAIGSIEDVAPGTTVELGVVEWRRFGVARALARGLVAQRCFAVRAGEVSG